MWHVGNAAVLLHLLVETPGTKFKKRNQLATCSRDKPSSASVSFLLQPSAQLRDPHPPPDAVLICQSYAGLLLATNAFCLLFLKSRGMHRFDDTGTMLAASLAIYHVFPVRRAWVRIQRGGHSDDDKAVALGGPVLHLVIHLLLLFLLAWATFSTLSSF